jgi:hypothetical protein
VTSAKIFARACARHSSRCVRHALLALVALLLVGLSAAPSFARAWACGSIACGQLAVSLSAEAADEGEEAEEGEEPGEEEEEGGEGSSEEDEEEEEAAASVEAEEEAEAEERRRSGKRHSARNRAPGGVIVLSKLRLTHKSATTLRHSPAASQVEFSFRLAKSMKVLVTLVKQGKPHARKRWTALPGDSLKIAAAKGSSHYRLKARNRLSAGRYRLTLWPSHGKPRSIYVNVRG